MSFFLRNIKDHWKMLYSRFHIKTWNLMSLRFFIISQLRPWSIVPARFPWKVRREFLEKCPLIGEHGFNKMADLGPQSFTNGTGPSQDSLRTRQEDNLNAWPQGNPLKPVAIVPPVHPFATPRIPNTRSIANGNRITMRTRYPISSSSSSIASLLPGWPDPAIGCHMARISCKGSFLSTFFCCAVEFSSRPFRKLIPMSKPVSLWFSLLIRGRESGPVFGRGGPSSERPFNPFVFSRTASERMRKSE